ncbi:acyltransferase family protein [Duganella hordei]|uniref:acyltransferase family protein n=1 Tax=Duganella hordei TaxID=2865934 RepID=UPI0030E77EC5
MLDKVLNARSDNLQILRFAAAGLVLITHITFYLHERVNVAVSVWHGGEIGVPIFFVISGFVMLLSGNKLARSADGAKIFLIRRYARVLPLYWLITTIKIVLVFAIPAAVLHNRPDMLKTIASYALFPMFNADGEVRPIHGVGWTLLHEMFFYYVFSLALVLRQSPLVFASLSIIFLCSLGLVLPAESAFTVVVFSNLNLLFVAGMVLASLYMKNLRLPPLIAALLLVCSVAAIALPDLNQIVRSSVGSFKLEAVLIVAAMLSLGLDGWPGLKKLLVRLGDSSYSLYLVHPIIAPMVCLTLFKLGLRSPGLILGGTILVVVPIAHLIYLLIEKRMNQKVLSTFKNRLLPAPRVSTF